MGDSININKYNKRLVKKYQQMPQLASQEVSTNTITDSSRYIYKYSLTHPHIGRDTTIDPSTNINIYHSSRADQCQQIRQQVSTNMKADP